MKTVEDNIKEEVRTNLAAMFAYPSYDKIVEDLGGQYAEGLRHAMDCYGHLYATACLKRFMRWFDTSKPFTDKQLQEDFQEFLNLNAEVYDK